MKLDNLSEQSALALWLSYVDKKQEAEVLNDHIDQLHEFIRRYRYRILMRQQEPIGLIDKLLASRPKGTEHE